MSVIPDEINTNSLNPHVAQLSRTIEALTEDRDSWRRVAHRLETEKQAALSQQDAVCVVENSDYITEIGGERKKAVRELYEGALKVGDTLYTAPPSTAQEDKVPPNGFCPICKKREKIINEDWCEVCREDFDYQPTAQGVVRACTECGDDREDIALHCVACLNKDGWYLLSDKEEKSIDAFISGHTIKIETFDEPAFVCRPDDVRAFLSSTPLEEGMVPKEVGANRYGLDMSYFRNLFDRELNRPLHNHTPKELARVLARASRTADREVMFEPEFMNGMVKVPVEITPQMWSKGRSEIERVIARIKDAPKYEMASAELDAAPQRIFDVLLEAASKGE